MTASRSETLTILTACTDLAGAGIGGLTAAVALLDAGIDCGSLAEQAPRSCSEVGARLLQLAYSNGTRVLFALRTRTELAARTGSGDQPIRPHQTVEYEGQDMVPALPWTRRWRRRSARFGSPMFLMHRGDPARDACRGRCARASQTRFIWNAA